jgi:restriction system protein
MKAWLVRAGNTGGRDSWCLENGYAGGGWIETPDLSAVTEPEQISQMFRENEPQLKPSAIVNYRAQLWKLRHKIQIGDLVALPLKSTHQVALGIVTGPDRYRDTEKALDRRHILTVDWKRTDVSRTAIGQDLLYSLGAFMTICELRRNDAVYRLNNLMMKGSDPGARTNGKDSVSDAQETDPDVENELTELDLEQLGIDAVVSKINEKFLGHEMARLVTAILIAKGFQCEMKPPGPDGGVDILAGSGPFGLDSPKVVVQVKSQSSQVGDEVVQTLQGAMIRFSAGQALLVAWGGISKKAKSSLENAKFSIRVWDSDELISQIKKHYWEFPEALRSELPLKQIWTIVPTTES